MLLLHAIYWLYGLRSFITWLIILPAVAPDIAIVSQRINDVMEVLSDFKNRRQPDRFGILYRNLYTLNSKLMFACWTVYLCVCIVNNFCGWELWSWYRGYNIRSAYCHKSVNGLSTYEVQWVFFSAWHQDGHNKTSTLIILNNYRAAS